MTAGAPLRRCLFPCILPPTAKCASQPSDRRRAEESQLHPAGTEHARTEFSTPGLAPAARPAHPPSRSTQPGGPSPGTATALPARGPPARPPPRHGLLPAVPGVPEGLCPRPRFSPAQAPPPPAPRSCERARAALPGGTPRAGGGHSAAAGRASSSGAAPAAAGAASLLGGRAGARAPGDLGREQSEPAAEALARTHPRSATVPTLILEGREERREGRRGGGRQGDGRVGRGKSGRENPEPCKSRLPRQGDAPPPPPCPPPSPPAPAASPPRDTPAVAAGSLSVPGASRPALTAELGAPSHAGGERAAGKVWSRARGKRGRASAGAGVGAGGERRRERRGRAARALHLPPSPPPLLQ